MTFTAGLKATVAVAGLVAVTAVGCGGSDTTAGQSTVANPTTTSATMTQPELLKDFVAEQDPMGVFKEGVYNLLRQPMGESVAIHGYRHQVAADGTTSNATVFAFNPVTDGWEPITNRELVWSPAQRKWVESDLAETLSPGPTGSRGWPTVTGVSDSGTSFYTLSYEELGGRPLDDGLEAGFAQGGALPQSAQTGKFSPGARAYVETTTTVDPTFNIQRVKDANANTDKLLPVYACSTPSPQCTTPAASLAMADKQGGQFTNFAGTARLQLDGNGHATLRPVDTDIAFANLTYQIVDTDGPARITVEAANPDDAEKFRQAIGITLENFALFEYDGQVTIGIAQPANSTNTFFAGYNQIAANDLITQWTPALPAVLP